MEATKQTQQPVQANQTSLKEAFVVWRKTSKKGDTHYFTGKTIVGFYNSLKQNPKEPDIRFYNLKEDGKPNFDSEYCSVWVKQSEKGKTYLSGKLGNDFIVGFKSEEDTTDTNRPYLKFYFQQPATTSNESVSTPGQPEEAFKEEVKETKPKQYKEAI